MPVAQQATFTEMVRFLQQRDLCAVDVGDLNRTFLDQIQPLKQLAMGIDHFAVVKFFAGKGGGQLRQLTFGQNIVGVGGVEKADDLCGGFHRDCPK